VLINKGGTASLSSFKWARGFLFEGRMVMGKIAILGATGYTGTELVRLLNDHPETEIVYVSSETYAGSKLSDIHPQFSEHEDLILSPMGTDQVPDNVDLAFCALPHGQSAGIVPGLLEKGCKVIDLSADFRLKKADLYNQWYEMEHPVPSLLEGAVYGLPELNRGDISTSRLVANPGCYPTSIILALAPLLKKKILKTATIIIDAKSGVSGAGRTPKQPFHFPDCTENFKAYRVACHQHIPEIEQELGLLAGETITITFTPHLVPMIRGILSTIYLKPAAGQNEEEIRAIYSYFYGECPFVRILEGHALPETRFVRGSNYIDIALKEDRRTGRLIIISALDNLVKGAAGQAVQNMNIMLGLPEDTALRQLPF